MTKALVPNFAMTVLLSLKDLGVIAFISAILSVIVVRWLDRRSAGRAKAGNPSPEMVVSRLYVHPIKSCRGIQVDEARFDAKGLEVSRPLSGLREEWLASGGV